METHDFTAAKVGDKVSHLIYGNGVIDSIDQGIFPINVKFRDHNRTFGIDGDEYKSSSTPKLYHNHNTFQIIATPVSPYKDGEWIAVKHGEEWKLAQYLGMENGGWATVRFNGDDETVPPCNYRFHKTLTELNSELNNL